jgi:hypothetical protein
VPAEKVAMLGDLGASVIGNARAVMFGNNGLIKAEAKKLLEILSALRKRVPAELLCT